MSAQAQPSVDEIVASLARSSLPTVVTEGRDDYLVFRRLEERLQNFNVSFIVAGGRSAVLEVFDRRSEYKWLPTAFIVDRDMWCFSGVPPKYAGNDVIVTEGYSIENDMYLDGEPSKLMTAEERILFDKELQEVCLWWSHVVERYIAGEEKKFSCHPNEILDASGRLCPHFIQRCGYYPAQVDIMGMIVREHAKLLRGKTLIHLLLRQILNPKRKSKYSFNNILDIASSVTGARLLNIESKIKQNLSIEP